MTTTRPEFYRFATAGERRAARRLVDAALDLEYRISVNDGGAWTVKRSGDRTEILHALCTTGEDRLRFERLDTLATDAGDAPIWRHVGSALLIWGNADDGTELVADHTDTAEMAAIVA